ncbi:purine-nucleoside phosphorylase [Simiduia sp. 21SJ11W-1]|uniref:purine-nucleoside phosphorylase n=1 Tax=Simiduia sp. 21SJ11W-1 TaxID=2909669 RepID=UPI0020A21F14|nr:purine-nucleoside phosphorylase [Simiduia sp. 21SJ11W-1]UTA48268.1 purine-nucleoside phosphorylase [Simiduia sp. 21SJ11W-1]
MTPHINAKAGDFAETVLMPGDPLRAKYIAENFLENARQVTDVRNMLGFTGEHKGKRISVMGSGMGIPSASIYARELMAEYGVKSIIRVGSCGAVSDDIKLRDLVIGMGACTDSNVNRVRFKGYDFAAIADYSLLEKAVNAARARNLPVRVGNVFSADLFYTPDTEMFQVMAKYGVLGVEMEAAGLYSVAAEMGGKALAICTVTDHILRGEAMAAADRQTSLTDMIELALECALQED